MMTEAEYSALYANARLAPELSNLKQLDYVCRVAVVNRLLYQLVQGASGIPWAVVACIHFRESNQSFKCHLHNGDPLLARTVRVPVGRPVKGHPPFTWTASAIDALTGTWRPKQWSLPGALEFLERYNGLGYRLAGVNSPYLWDFTSQYSSGLFTADGHFDPKARENRPGAASILKAFELKGIEHGLPDIYPGPSQFH